MTPSPDDTRKGDTRGGESRPTEARPQEVRSDKPSASAPKRGGHGDLPLSYARTLSWLSLVIILTTSLGLSVFISNSARETLLRKQENFANLLAANLNHQIYRRFTVPTVLAYGRVALRQPAQYERLEQVIKSVIHGLQIERLRIYDFGRVVAYSTDSEDLGRTGLAPPGVEEALQGSTPKFEILSTFPMWQAPFRVPLESGSFVLRTIYPLRGEPVNVAEDSAPIMGVLELSQDITSDYEAVLAFQGLIVGMCLLSSVVLFSLLLLLIRRAERVLADRMAKNRALERELHSTEKLVSMGRVVASIAHEIRNPLGIIRSSAELLQRRTDGTDATTSRILGAIYDESRRLSQTVNDFLDYARPRQPRQDMVDVGLVMEQVMAFLESELGRSQVAVERHVEEGLLAAGDKDLLYRAFYNILVNGQQAMDGPGIIRVDGYREGNSIVLSFTDSGPGFDLDHMPNVLDPFYTTKEGGTGLGLAIVKSIIASHEGSVELENAEDSGARVLVRLPAAPMPVASTAAPQAAEATPVPSTAGDNTSHPEADNAPNPEHKATPKPSAEETSS